MPVLFKEGIRYHSRESEMIGKVSDSLLLRS